MNACVVAETLTPYGEVVQPCYSLTVSLAGQLVATNTFDKSEYVVKKTLSEGVGERLEFSGKMFSSTLLSYIPLFPRTRPMYSHVRKLSSNGSVSECVSECVSE